MNHMLKKCSIMVLSLIVFCGGMTAQDVSDTTMTIIEDLEVPLVEKRYVANSNFHDNWYLSLYGGVTSNWGSDGSHEGFFQVM